MTLPGLGLLPQLQKWTVTPAMLHSQRCQEVQKNKMTAVKVPCKLSSAGEMGSLPNTAAQREGFREVAGLREERN